MNKPPAFQFYAADFLVDGAVKLMTLEQRGAYVTLLAHAWIEGALPRSATKLAVYCGVSVEDMKRIWPGISACWKPAAQRGFIVNPRLEKERQKQASYRKSQSQKALTRQASPKLASAEPLPSSPSSSPSPKHKPSSPKATGGSWLSPFLKAWTATYGGNANAGRLAKSLKPLTEAHAPGEVLDHWTRYLAATEARYASPERFAETFGSWAKPERSKQVAALPDAYLTLEEQAARNAKARSLKNAPRDDVQMLTDVAGGP